MNPRTPDDADLERILTERLDAEVQDVTAGTALLDRIKADTSATTGARRAGRPSARWLLPVAAAAAAVLAVVFITVEDDNGTDVATRENLDGPETQVTREVLEGTETQVVLSGETGGEEWTVVEYVEDDPVFVDEPTTCLRFEPAIEDGPVFCGTDENLVGANGRLVLRRGQRFNDHAVFAGVFAPRVAEVTLGVDGQQLVIEPQPWPGRDLRVGVVMQPVPDDADYDVVLRDSDDQVLSSGSSGGGGDQADPVPQSVVAEPGAAAPGQTVELRFPTEMTRDVAWHMSRFDLRTQRWSEPLYLLISDRGDGTATAPTWLPQDAEWTWDSIVVTGPGPDSIVIPDTAEDGPYVVCPADDVGAIDFPKCAAVTVAAG